MSESTKKANKNTYGLIISTIVIVLVIILGFYSVLGVLAWTWNPFWNPTESGILSKVVQQQVEKNEIQKAWGLENYNLMQKLYNSDLFKTQQKQSLESALNQVGVPSGQGQGSATDNGTSLNPQFKKWTVNVADLPNYLSGTYVNGTQDENTKLLWIEFSDLECPFCKRLHDAGTVNEILWKRTDIAHVFMHFPLDFHPNAQKSAEWVECIAELWGQDKFYKAIDTIFTNGAVDPASVKKVATDLKVNAKQYDTCLSSNKYADKIKAQQAIGQNVFQVTWTPWSVLISLKTGEWVLVPGAYPTSEFEKVISYLESK